MSNGVLVSPSDPPVYKDVQQLVGRDLGQEDWGSRVNHVSYSSATETAHTIRNRDVGGHQEWLKSTDASRVAIINDSGMGLTNLSVGNLQVDDNTTLGNAAADALIVNATSTFQSPATFQAALTANANVTLGDAAGDSLTVNATSTFQAAASFNANVTIGDAAGDTLTVNATSTFQAALTANANVTLGDAAGDTLTVNATSTFTTSVTVSSGNLTISTGNETIAAGNLTVTAGSITAGSTVQGTRLISTIATGTAPLTVASTTKVTNLNADSLDDHDSSFFLDTSGTGQTKSGALTVQGTLTATGTVAIGDANADVLTVIATSTFRNAANTATQLYVDAANNRVIVGTNSALSGASNDLFTVSGGRAYFAAEGTDAGVGLRYNAAGGNITLGASNSGTPDFVVKNNAGTQLFRVFDNGAAALGTDTSSSTVKLKVTGDLEATGILTLGGATTVSTGTIRIPNNQFLYSETSAGTDKRVIGIDSSDFLRVGDSVAASGVANASVGAGTAVFLAVNSAVMLECETSGVSFFGAGSYGGGSNVIFIANRLGAPGSNPSGGGILYAEAGAGKWRGSGGTTTTFGPADPHCPTCDRDFALEWESERYGSLALCMWCLTAGFTRGIIRREEPSHA